MTDEKRIEEPVSIDRLIERAETLRAVYFVEHGSRWNRMAANQHGMLLSALKSTKGNLELADTERIAQQTRIVELERALVDMRFTACAALVWGCDSNPDTFAAVRTVKALAEAYVEATAQRDAERARAERAEAERDARPAVSPEDAHEFLRLMVQHDFDMRLRYSDTAVRVGEAINSHAAKVGGGT